MKVIRPTARTGPRRYLLRPCNSSIASGRIVNSNTRRMFVWLVAAVVIMAGATACASEEDAGARGDTPAADGSRDDGGSGGGNKATDDYTPHVGPRQAVIVDTLTWRVQGVRTAGTVGGDYLNETAAGEFVIVDVSVRNGKDESVTLSGDQATLVAAGKEYSSDTAAALTLSSETGGESLFLEELGPDLTQGGTLVFDVPPAVLQQNPEICFGELGFGPSRGCIRIRI